MADRDRDAAPSPRLPALLVLTDRRACQRQGRSLVGTVAAIAAAVESPSAIADRPRDDPTDDSTLCVVLREKDLPTVERAALAADVRGVARRLIVASDAALAERVGADGVHLAGDDRWPPDGDRSGSWLVGRSCHDGADVAEAARNTASYATLSPIFESSSKPGYGPALGPDALAGRPVPMYALGGVEPARIGSCIAAGATGVAVMGAVMAAADPGAVVRQALDQIHAARGGRAIMRR